MPEAVIVAAARSPIGRAAKGSMTTIRGDDLAAQMVRAALDQVPELDPTEVVDLMMGCGQPGGEQPREGMAGGCQNAAAPVHQRPAIVARRQQSDGT